MVLISLRKLFEHRQRDRLLRIIYDLCDGMGFFCTAHPDDLLLVLEGEEATRLLRAAMSGEGGRQLALSGMEDWLRATPDHLLEIIAEEV